MIEMPTINVVYMYISVYSLEIKLILSFYGQKAKIFNLKMFLNVLTIKLFEP